MPKKVMQDVVPPEKRSIRNVPLPKHKKETSDSAPSLDAAADTPSEDTAPRMAPIDRRRRRRVPMWGVWAITVASLLIVVFAVSTLFTSATVVVTPKQQSREISLPLTIGPEGDLSFETIEVTERAQRTVPITETEQASEAATGRITVYNDHTTNEFPLVVNTRFEAPNGNIYRSTEALRIPGKSGDGGGATPGSTTVTVRASEPGASYNLTEGRLTVPGLKGEPSFDGIYAEVTTAITGGFEGERGVIDPAERENTEQALRAELRETASAGIQNQIPDRFILYPDLVGTAFEPLVQSSVNENEALLDVTATVHGVMLPRQDLEQLLVRTFLPQQEDLTAVSVRNLTELTFTPSDPYRSQQSSVTGTLSGTAHFVWKIDEGAIKANISGRDKDRLDVALAQFEEIESASATVQPFWLMSFPSNPNDITVTTSLGQTVEDPQAPAQEVDRQQGTRSATGSVNTTN